METITIDPESVKLEQVLSEWTTLLPVAVYLSAGDTKCVYACFTIRDDAE
jgi:hypothetical protein